MQRVDTKAQSALDLKKQNLKDETKRRKELVKSMEEVKGHYILLIWASMISSLVKTKTSKLVFLHPGLGQENACGKRKRGF